MNPKTLDALLLDRAAGLLPADVSQLLDAYLTQHPAAAHQGRRYDATVGLLRAAMHPTTSAAGPTVPPYPARRIQAARSRRRVLAIIRPLAMVACLGLAFILGGKLAQSPAPSEPMNIAVADAAPIGGFWAYPAARIIASPPRALASSPVRWSSPLRWPQPGGSS